MISPSTILYAINGNAPCKRGVKVLRSAMRLDSSTVRAGRQYAWFDSIAAYSRGRPAPSLKRLQRFAPQVGETYGAKTRLVWEDDPRENDEGQYTDYLFDFNQNHIPHCGPLQKRAFDGDATA